MTRLNSTPRAWLPFAGVVLTTALVFFASGAHAGVLGDMTQMFMSNSTAPSTLSTSDRVGAFGGSFEMRAPTQTVNLVSFDRPRFDAGCGGIDLYGGSFSFINSQQLVQIFRAVAANAVGLAFKAAIKAISPSLDALITEFQTLLQHMNNLAKNSCQLAHLVVNGAESSLGVQVNADGAIGATHAGMFTDTFSTLTGYLASADSYLPKAASVNPKSGNTNMKAVMSSGSSSILGIAGLGNFDGSADNVSNPNSLNNRVLISMMGYDTTGLPCANQNASGTPDTASAAAVMSTMSCTGAPTIALNDLIEGGGAGSINPAAPLILYTCVDVNGTVIPGGVDPQICTVMRADTYNYPGIRGFINVALFGYPDPALGITPTSILGQFNSGSTITLSPSQVQLIHQSGIPLLQLLAATSNPSTRVAIAQRLSEHVVACVASAVGEALYKAANGIQTGGEITLSDDTKGRITTMKTDFMGQRQQCLYDHRVLDVIHELNESTRLTAGNIK